jgi:16S rRNA (guanine527-N7)-methyltransferase
MDPPRPEHEADAAATGAGELAGLVAVQPRFAEYARLLESWTGLLSGPALPLIEDSLSLLSHLEGARTVVDVGSGGGMPGLPLKLARPELQVTLLESDRRKAAFLVHAAARLDLDVEVVAERAETAGRGPLRDSFDLAVSRALAGPVSVLLELCLPLVRPGGRLLAMRTAGDAVQSRELETAAAAAEALGGGRPLVRTAPSAARERGAVLIVPKLSPTPGAFPRRPGVPNRRPLGE